MIEMNAKKIGLIILLLLFFLAVISFPVLAQKKEADEKRITLDEEMRAKVVERVGQLMRDNYIFKESAEKMAEKLDTQLEERKYNKMDDVFEFSQALTQDLRSVSKDRHIRVTYNPERVRSIRASRSKSEEERERERRANIERQRQQNFGFKKIELLEGNIGYLDLRYFSGSSQAGETIVAAMNFLANANAVIIDLCNNGGGSPYTIQIISSYFLEAYTHLNSFEWRGGDSLEQFWTLQYVPGKKMYDTDLYILTSPRTFSAAEEFTYNMKNLKRATLVGETTGGGAHPGGDRIVNDYFLVWVPSGRAINPISKTNWEGEGITPHISVPQDQALDKAHSVALEKLLEKTEDEGKKRQLMWALDGIEAKTEPATVDQEILKKYVGNFTRGEVSLKEGELFIQAGPRQFRMIPLSEAYFVLDGEPSIRVEFIFSDETKEYEIIGHFPDGRKEIVKRVKSKK
ncbi:MAG: S41 family peptidase [Candidatus Aminicenantes bacterium]|nr:MAG: S41 family peptidase [Candidatus Aminicenantes bacterium]